MSEFTRGIFNDMPYDAHRCPFPIDWSVNGGACLAHWQLVVMIDGMPVSGPKLFLPKGHIVDGLLKEF